MKQKIFKGVICILMLMGMIATTSLPLQAQSNDSDNDSATLAAIDQAEAEKTEAHSQAKSRTKVAGLNIQALGSKITSIVGTGTYWQDNGVNNRRFYDANNKVFGGENSIRVLDISQWNKVDWNQVKASGKVDAVILRCGYGWGGEDIQFAHNVSECKRLKIPYAIYLFSYANTASQASLEASFVYSLINKYQLSLCMPIYYDLESWSYKEGGKVQNNPETTARYKPIVNNFVSYLKDRGYPVNIYASRSWFAGKSGEYLNDASILKYASWTAAWTPVYGWTNKYYSGCTGWQYSSSERISGIEGNVDVSAFHHYYGGVDIQNTTDAPTGKSASEPTMNYRANSKYIGWLNKFNEPNTAGTTGRSLPLYQLQIGSTNESKAFNLSAKIYISDHGWVNYANIESTDTIGIYGSTMELVNFSLSDQPGYKLQYRVHSSTYGWLGWTSEGNNAGVSGKIIQAIEFRLVADSNKTYDTVAFAAQAHVAKVGWQTYRPNNIQIGTPGESKAIEAIHLGYANKKNASINAAVYVNGIGLKQYQDVNYDTLLGTTGQSRALQGIKLSTAYGDGVKLRYRVHFSGVGWTGWVDENSYLAYPEKHDIEAIQIESYPEINVSSLTLNKNNITLNIGDTNQLQTTINPSNTNDGSGLSYQSSNSAVASVSATGLIRANASGSANITVSATNGVKSVCQVRVNKHAPIAVYSTHQAKIGWSANSEQGANSGKVGSDLRLEAIKAGIRYADTNYNLKIKLHIQKLGWVDYGTISDSLANMKIAGTTGRSLRIEAMKCDLSGLSGYKLQYAVYIHGIGWSSWTDENKMAGTIGAGLAIESVKMRIVTADSADNNARMLIATHIQKLGWSGFNSAANISGQANSGRRIEAFRLCLQNMDENVYLSGAVHVQNIGWINYAKISASTLIGTTGKGQRIESINLKLNNNRDYSFQYRVYIQGVGWTGWINEGNNAGTSGQGRRIEAMQFRISEQQ